MFLAAGDFSRRLHLIARAIACRWLRRRRQATLRRDSSLEITRSIGTPLKLPCCFESILDRTSVASCEVSDHHHVLAITDRHTEGFGKLPQDRGAVVEVGSDHHMGVVELAGDEPAV